MMTESDSDTDGHVHKYSDVCTGVETVVIFGEWINVKKSLDGDQVMYKYADSVTITTGERVVILDKGSFFGHTDRHTNITTLWCLADIIAHGDNNEPHLRAQRVISYQYGELYITNDWNKFTTNNNGQHIADITEKLSIASNVASGVVYWWKKGYARFELFHLGQSITQDTLDDMHFYKPPMTTLTPNEHVVFERERDEDQKIRDRIPAPKNPDIQLSNAAKRLLQRKIEADRKRDAVENPDDRVSAADIEWFMTEDDVRNSDSKETKERVRETKELFDNIVDRMVASQDAILAKKVDEIAAKKDDENDNPSDIGGNSDI